jgi:Flp pilus assembly protein TadG
MGMRDIFGKWRRARRGGDTFLGRLAHDTRGNVLAIMAAALIPFCGMVGGGLDLSRMYLTKTRLQHACDAGALAGRKKMGSGTWSATGANTAAREYFDANYTSTGMYGGNAPTVAFTENAGKVTGTASAVLPMTLMKVLGKTTETLTVTCDAEMRLPNTDIMFTLDTTGSMGDTLPGDTKTKMAALKGAVKCFYEIVARLDTTEVCGPGSGPSGGTGNQVQIRFGFMPYSMNVNVGKLLPTSYFADSWPYQSRLARWWVVTKLKLKKSQPLSLKGVPQDFCNLTVAASYGYTSFSETFPGSVTVPPFPTGQKRKVERVDLTAMTWTSADLGTCSATQTESDIEYELREGVTPAAGDEFEDWRYDQITHDITGLKNGTTWNNSFQRPVGANGTNKTITWQGCIEERRTVRTTDYDPIPSDADDMDIDAVPSQGDANSLWGPALPELLYLRATPSTYNWDGQYTRDAQYTSADYYAMSNGDGNYGCPSEAKKLQAWPVASTFESYVNGLNPVGNTYHDIGLIWGGRFMSPTGLFRSENEYTPQGGEIDRHMIFMTDGDACTGVSNYTAYGIAWFDRRQTAANAVPTAGCTNNDRTLTQQVNLRTEALCEAIKNKNITLWVISFGSLANSTLTRLQNCATTGRYYSANNSTQLYETFASIANQISQLRLTK